MSIKEKQSWSSFLSIIFILSSLFFTLVFNMEIRRKGYEFWGKFKKAENLQDQNRVKRSDYAKKIHEQMKVYLQKNKSLKPATPGQILRVKKNVIFKQ